MLSPRARDAEIVRYARDHGHIIVARMNSRIILIDGEKLVRLMIDHDVAVSTAASYAIKKIDQDYFTEA